MAMPNKYSVPFQKVIDACKGKKWILVREGNIVLAADHRTCPMSVAIGRTGLCNPLSAGQALGFRLPEQNGWLLADAADNRKLECKPLAQRVRQALINELKPHVEGGKK